MAFGANAIEPELTACRLNVAQKFEIGNRGKYLMNDNKSPAHPMRIFKSTAFILLICNLVCLCWISTSAVAQVPRSTLPNERYLFVHGALYRGEYRDAFDVYQDYSRSAYRFGNVRYLDSVCYWTMMGECKYHVGKYADAIDHYEEALKLYVAMPTWHTAVQFPPNIAVANSAIQRARITWGTPKRRMTIGSFPDTFSVQFGDMAAGSRVQEQGGVYNPAELRPVNVVEVMRCVALALHRRTEIKGRINQHDPFTGDLIDKLSSSGPGTESMAGAWQRIFVGIASRSKGDLDKAKIALASSLDIGGLDHPLTPVALVELGHVAVAQKQLDVAAEMFLEASYSAAIFGQYDLCEEALRWGSIVHMMRGAPGIYAPLPNAIIWANRNEANQMAASLLVQLAWNQAERGAGADAIATLKDTRRPMGRTDIANSLVGSRLLYVSALASFQQNDTKTGLSELAASIKQFQYGSKWIYQLSLADTLARSTRVTDREADLLYSEMLREPNDFDWMVDPMEPMTFLLTPHTAPMERWFEINMKRKQTAKAIEIADQIRRHRFFESLSLGGRLMSFRWMLEAPDAALKKDFLQARQDLLARYPAYKQLSDQAVQIMAQIDQLPLTPDFKTDEGRKQLQLLKDLENVSQLQEAVLAAMALKREPSQLVFPPKMEIREVQEKMREKQIIIICTATKRGYYVTSITRNEYKLESELATDILQKGLSRLLKELGNTNANGDIDVEVLQDKSWQTTASQFTKFIFPQRAPDFWNDFEEVTVVPDGMLWYLPFEILNVGTETEPQVLFSKLDVRYAPTMSTSVPDGRNSQRFARTVVVQGRINNRDDDARIQTGFDDLKNDVPGAVSIDSRHPGGASVFSATVDQLLVWNDLKTSSRLPYAITPMSIAGSRNDLLSDMMQLPWQGIEHVILPGMSTSAASGARSDNSGNELFLTACGLMASGSRTVVLSRWKVGGQSTLDLTREFIRELPTSSASQAWRRSVELLQRTQLDYNAETRVRATRNPPVLKMDHPFFWAGYLVIDMGSQAGKGQPAAKKDDADEKAAADAAADGAADGDGAKDGAAEKAGEAKKEDPDKKDTSSKNNDAGKGEGTDEKANQKKSGEAENENGGK
jgi:hypothetical protein